MLKPPEPIIVASFFPEIHTELIAPGKNKYGIKICF